MRAASLALLAVGAVLAGCGRAGFGEVDAGRLLGDARLRDVSLDVGPEAPSDSPSADDAADAGDDAADAGDDAADAGDDAADAGDDAADADDDAADAGAPPSRVRWAEALHVGAGCCTYHDVAVDGVGNVVVVLSFGETARVGETTVTSAGSTDFLVAKLDAGGALRWARALGGSDGEVARAAAAGADGRSYVGGRFAGTFTDGAHTVTSAGGWDMLVVALEADGSVAWVRALGGPSTDEVMALAVDPAGNLVVVGESYGPADFGTGTLDASDSSDAVVVGLAPDGATRWAWRYAGLGVDDAWGVAVADDGSVLATGRCTWPAALGVGPACVDGAFVVRLDGGGAVGWASVLPGAWGFDVAFDLDGGVLVAGSYDRFLRVDGELVLTGSSSGHVDAFALGLDPGGGFRWVAGLGAWNPDYAYGIAPRAGGGAIFAGTFSGIVDVGGASYPVALGAAFLAEVDATGAYLAFEQLAGEYGYAYALSSSAAGVVAATGLFRGSLPFGESVLVSEGTGSAWVARVD